jgi:hypothetical protein
MVGTIIRAPGPLLVRAWWITNRTIGPSPVRAWWIKNRTIGPSPVRVVDHDAAQRLTFHHARTGNGPVAPMAVPTLSQSNELGIRP